MFKGQVAVFVQAMLENWEWTLSETLLDVGYPYYVGCNTSPIGSLRPLQR